MDMQPFGHGVYMKRSFNVSLLILAAFASITRPALGLPCVTLESGRLEGGEYGYVAALEGEVKDVVTHGALHVRGRLQGEQRYGPKFIWRPYSLRLR